MFYISRRRGSKYGVVDTSDGVEEFYTKERLKSFYDRGIDIEGVSYVDGLFVVTPTIRVDSKESAAKNKLMLGTTTGHKGFELKFEGNKVIALPINKEFLLNLKKISGTKSKVVLSMPDVVTHIADGFHKTGTGTPTRFIVSLPRSLKEIGADAFTLPDVCTLKFNSIVDKVHSSKRGEYGSSLWLTKDVVPNNIIPVREFYTNSVLFVGDYDTMVKLPYTKILHTFAFGTSSDLNLSFELGKDIELVSDFVKARFNEGFKVFSIMRVSPIVYFDKDSSPRFNLVSKTKSYRNGKDISSYIYVMHESFYNRYLDVFNKGTGNDYAMVGIITYKNDDELNKLKSNLVDYCQDYTKHFKVRLTRKDLGKFVVLKFKE